MKTWFCKTLSVFVAVVLAAVSIHAALPCPAHAVASADAPKQTVTQHEPEHQVLAQEKKPEEKSTWYWWVLAGLVIAGGAAAAAGGGGSSGGGTTSDSKVSVSW